MRFFERQVEEGETPAAWRAFQCYRDLGEARSVDRAYELYSGRQLCGKRAPGRFQKWARDNDWVDRAQAWDDWHEMIRQEAIAEHKRNSGSDLARREAAVQERVLSVKEQLLDKMETMAKWPLQKESMVHERYDDGREKKVTEVFPAKWSFSTLVRALEALDDSPDKIDLRRIDFNALTDEQLERIANGEDPIRVILEGRGDDV